MENNADYRPIVIVSRNHNFLFAEAYNSKMKNNADYWLSFCNVNFLTKKSYLFNLTQSFLLITCICVLTSSRIRGEKHGFTTTEMVRNY